MREIVKLFFFMLCAFLSFGCSTLKNADNKQQANLNLPMYEEGRGRADMILAVLRPAGISLEPEEEKYRDIIQSALNHDVAKFSAIQLSDRRNQEEIEKIQQESLSGKFSEEQYIRIGQLAQSKFIINGSITKLPNAAFNLELSLTDVESGLVQSTSIQSIRLRDIINSSASRKAISDLLRPIGVVFTLHGEEELKKELTAEETEAQNALALSYEASRSGNLIDALIYSYAASSSDTSSTEAKSQTAAVFKLMGGTGSAIKEDFDQQNFWKKNLTDFENFFRSHPPYELSYTFDQNQKGIPNYDDSTVTLEFTIGLRHKTVSTMQRILNDILKELKKNPYRKWGFNNWPAISASSSKENQIQTDIFNSYTKFDIEVGILDEYDIPVKKAVFPLYGQLQIKKILISAFSTQERKLSLTVNQADLPDNWHIKVLSINGINADEANAVGFMQNSLVQKMPARSRNTIDSKNIIVPELPEDMEKRLASEAKNQKKIDAASQKNQEKRLAAINKELAREEMWAYNRNEKRSNIFINAMYNPLQGNNFKYATTFETGLGFGTRNFSIDFRFVYPLSAFMDKTPGLLGFGGALGYSFVWDAIIISLEGGGTYHHDLTDKIGAFIPTFEAKVDIVAGNPGLGLRLAYKMEMGSPDWGIIPSRMFNQNNSFGSDTFRIIGNPTFGIVLWY
jgi:hypothetical protein